MPPMRKHSPAGSILLLKMRSEVEINGLGQVRDTQANKVRE